MTDQNYTNVDKLLLEVCKEYLKCTHSTPAEFAEEMMDLASQHCEMRGTDYRNAFLELTVTS